MEDEAPPPQEEESTGAPAWMATFADLATLLMSFFVLILSFSELDVLKYKQIAGSLSEAFGVQREVKSRESPRGLNVIAKEFSPGKPKPTPLNRVKQDTSSNLKKYVSIQAPEGTMGKTPKKAHDAEPSPENQSEQAQVDEREQKLNADKVRNALKEEIERGIVEVSTDQKKVIIRIRERGSFPSGDAKLMSGFKPVLGKIRDVLASTSGQVVIAGHTDNVPIATTRFRSNWELSSARAVSVVEELLREGGLEPGRFQVAGYADTKPIDDNNSIAGRATNRRVELMIVQGTDRPGGSLSAQQANPAGEQTQPADTVELMQVNNSVLMELIRGFSADDDASN